MKNKNIFLLLLLILLYALIIRLYSLSDIDLGSAWDEGYYSEVARNISNDSKLSLSPILYINNKQLSSSYYKDSDRIIIDKTPLLMILGSLTSNLFNNEIYSFRLVSVFSGVLTVLIIYLLFNYIAGPNFALFGAFLLSTNPLHISYSRIFQTDILSLLFVIFALYFVFKIIREEKVKYYVLLGLMIFLNMFSRQMAYLPVFLSIIIFLIILFYLKQIDNKKLIKTTSCIIIGFCFSFIWILILYLNSSAFDAIWRDPGASEISVFLKPLLSKYSASSFLLNINNLFDFENYKYGGNFSFYFLLPQIILSLIGLTLSINELFRAKAKQKYLDIVWILWFSSFILYQLSHSHHISYLLVLLPPTIFWATKSLSIKKHVFTKTLLFVFIPFCTILPFVMIANEREVLQDTEYAKMAKYISLKTLGNDETAIVTYAPTFTYYLRKPVQSHLYLKNKSESYEKYMRENNIRFVEMELPGDLNNFAWAKENNITRKEFDWVFKNCVDVSENAGIKTEEKYHLFDCWKKDIGFPYIWALNGRVVMDEKIEENAFIIIKGNKIYDIVEEAQLNKYEGIEKTIFTEGTIYPGLINLHDHFLWNYLNTIKVTEKYNSFFEFQKSKSYKKLKKEFNETRNKLACTLNDYSEFKKLINGETSVQSSYQYRCPRNLIRNLNDWDEFYGFNLLKDSSSSYFRNLNKKELYQRKSGDFPYIVYLGEGLDEKLNNDLYEMDKHQRLHEKTIIIHGVSFGEKELDLIYKRNASLVWSLSSNLNLFGETLDVLEASKKGIRIAIGSDWSLTGSLSLLDELKIVKKYNEEKLNNHFSNRDLFEMLTLIPSVILGLNDKIGKISRGYYADLLVIDDQAQGDPFDNFVNAKSENLSLVLVDGKALVGKEDIMKTISSAFHLFKFCGQQYQSIINPNEISQKMNESEKISLPLLECK
ncbi:MAG: glycosyltransferase family 39 protein [Pseudomonadota bacterium]